MSKATSLKGMVNKILKENKYDVERLLCDCLELYTGAIDSLNQSFNNVKSCDYTTATMLMSAAKGCTGHLRNWIHRKKKACEISIYEREDVLFHMVLIPLVFTNMLDMKISKCFNTWIKGNITILIMYLKSNRLTHCRSNGRSFFKVLNKELSA